MAKIRFVSAETAAGVSKMLNKGINRQSGRRKHIAPLNVSCPRVLPAQYKASSERQSRRLNHQR
jgi:hypothetical protein